MVCCLPQEKQHSTPCKQEAWNPASSLRARFHPQTASFHEVTSSWLESGVSLDHDRVQIYESNWSLPGFPVLKPSPDASPSLCPAPLPPHLLFMYNDAFLLSWEKDIRAAGHTQSIVDESSGRDHELI